jgi:hypothetical protein
MTGSLKYCEDAPEEPTHARGLIYSCGTGLPRGLEQHAFRFVRRSDVHEPESHFDPLMDG